MAKRRIAKRQLRLSCNRVKNLGVLRRVHCPPHVKDCTAASVSRPKKTLFFNQRIWVNASSNGPGSFGIAVVENTSMSRNSPELFCSSGIDGCMTLMTRMPNGCRPE